MVGKFVRTKSSRNLLLVRLMEGCWLLELNIVLIFKYLAIILNPVVIKLITCNNNCILKLRFLALSTGIIYCYYAMVLKVDEEEFGGHGALLQEGLFASVTLFLVL